MNKCSKCGKEENIASIPGEPDLCMDCFFGTQLGDLDSPEVKAPIQPIKKQNTPAPGEMHMPRFV